MTNDNKYYCVSGLVSLVIEYLRKDYPNKSNIELLTIFLSSNTYKLMCNLKTALWAEGPLYIYDLYNHIH